MLCSLYFRCYKGYVAPSVSVGNRNKWLFVCLRLPTPALRLWPPEAAAVALS